ncbi:MAG: recombinase family protein [Phycisphaeraceae bacterium]
MIERRTNKPKLPPLIRCAIYTRKSTDEGLELDFNSLDAQRESAESYIASQRHEGWTCLPQRYDDGGYTGGNMDRPALKQLTADIEAGLVDCVVVYKVDRLSRSLLDFARMMEVFDKHKVSFVSVTQQFNTTHSMGRLTLNILLSFAQFEREIISERTRDKIAAARRKGKWSGGWPLLGYNIVTSPSGSRIEPNPKEAKRVVQIFELFLEEGSLMPAVKELNRRGWRNKRWTTKKGRDMGGKAFDKPALHRLLSSVVYIGKITHGDSVYDGEHDAIVPLDLYNNVQALLRSNKRSGGKYAKGRNKNNAMLRGLVQCASCGVAMTHHFTTKRKNGKATTRYRYYVCANAQKKGWDSCPTASVPAPALEQFVVDQIREVGRSSQMFRDVLYAAQEQITDAIDELRIEHDAAKQNAKRIAEEIRELAPKAGLIGAGTDQLAELQDELTQAEQEVTQIGSKIIDLERKLVDDRAIAKAIEAFDPVWESLSPAEQTSIVQMLIERVDYDGENDSVSVAFRSASLGQQHEEVTA